MNIVTSPQEVEREITLAEHAAVIRALGKRVVGDIIEIGRRPWQPAAVAGAGVWVD
jgi:hypothetical protein